jgi:hypothetical protein
MRILLWDGEVYIPPWGIPITHLEILCHGTPAHLHFSQHIDYKNVESFAAALRTVMNPLGFIEVLACLVAQHKIHPLRLQNIMFESNTAFEQDSSILQYTNPGTPPALQLPSWLSNLPLSTIRIEAVEAYFQPIFEAQDGVRSIKDLPRQETTLKKELAEYDARNSAKSATLRDSISMDQIKSSEQLFKQALLTRDFGQDRNGLDFCLRFTRVSNCIVRASETLQYETSKDSRNFDTFGDWDGRVWDFLPDGNIKYLGKNLRRVGLVFPETWSGPLSSV